MGRKSKEKGKVGEREAAREWARVMRCEGRRGAQFSGGSDSPDVKHSLPGVHVEVKRAERLRLYDAIEQAETDSGDKVPVVLYRANYQKWVAIVPLDDLPRLATLISDFRLQTSEI